MRRGARLEKSLEGETTFDGFFRTDVQVEDNIRLNRVAVEVVYPGWIDATCRITSKGSIDVAVGQDNLATSKGGLNDLLSTIKMVGGKEQTIG